MSTGKTRRFFVFCWGHGGWEMAVKKRGRWWECVCVCVSCLSGRETEVLCGEAVNLCVVVKSHKKTIKTFKGILNWILWAFLLLLSVCLCVATSQTSLSEAFTQSCLFSRCKNIDATCLFLLPFFHELKKIYAHKKVYFSQIFRIKGLSALKCPVL